MMERGKARAGSRLKPVMSEHARPGRSFAHVSILVIWCKWFGPDSYCRRERSGGMRQLLFECITSVFPDFCSYA